jgi:hypothetical protein
LFFPLQLLTSYAQVATQQQTPADAPQQQSTSGGAQKPAPAAAPETPLNTSDAQLSLQLFYWLNSSQPNLRGGAANVGPYPGNLDYPGKPKRIPGGLLSVPAGRNNTLRISYFRVQGNGNTTVNSNLTLFNTDYSPGDYLVSSYTLQNVKISYDYLSFPFPADPARFRLKTLWEVQYTTIKSSLDAPLKTVATDASGNAIPNTAAGARRLVYPTFGLAMEKAFTPQFRLEAKASGFAFPHHATVWDAEASAVFRTGRFEVSAGVKAFHFKTSPQNAQYLVATFPGAFVAVRYYPKWFW